MRQTAVICVSIKRGSRGCRMIVPSVWSAKQRMRCRSKGVIQWGSTVFNIYLLFRFSNLFRHMLSSAHLNFKRFLCSFPGCTKRFNSKRDLHHHSLSHAEDWWRQIRYSSSTFLFSSVQLNPKRSFQTQFFKTFNGINFVTKKKDVNMFARESAWENV